ncbi:hypothetical protein V5O48_007003 [Marasmius crinis-equi]|uniref:SMP-30/Gluconolactonase/LRE-like region domain-containing protein n=1 Tax=Marasmius crinis-equi TaxID=585013 RepID=A0ABR3FHX6_9AGAR
MERLFEMKDALNMSLSQAAPYNGPYFPTVSYEDNVRAQYATLVDALGVWEVFCAIGFSMGGQQVSLDSGNETCFRDIDATSEAYHWAVIFPEVVKNFIEGPKAALLASKDFENGHYKAPPEIGIRAFGRVYSGWAYGQEWYRNKQHLYDGTYADLNTFIRENWEMRFLDWDANDMLTLINTWQQGDVSIVRDGGDFEKCLGSIKAQGLIMPCKTDLYFPPEDNEAEVKLMKNARLVVIDSPCGHMAAVGTDPADTVFITQEVKAFLDGYYKMGSRTWGIAVSILAISVGLYYQYVAPILDLLNAFRVPQPLNNFRSCSIVPDLQACEKLVLHQPSGKLFLACSTLEGRPHWIPGSMALNASRRSEEDYVAIFDPASKGITRLALDKFDSKRGISVHGMDVVPSASNPKELFVYLVNHRVPLQGDAERVGADSAIEIFKTTLSSGKLTHMRTVENPAIITPNDVVGYPDGKSFYFTNDHGVKVSWMRGLRELFSPASSVGYCHVEQGCKLVSENNPMNNGITRAPNDTIYVASTTGRAVRVFERQEDNSLVLMDEIPCEAPLDNVSIDSDGVVWAAGFPDGLALGRHIRNSSLPSPSGAWKFKSNAGPDSNMRKLRVEKAFEDKGEVASGTTSVVHDAQRGLVFFHGVVAHRLTVCKV